MSAIQPESNAHGQGELVIKNVSKSFGKNEVLKNIDLEVKSGTVTALIGPSGSGKSTLLRTVNLIEPPSSGRINFDGVPLLDSDLKFDTDGLRRRNRALLRIGMVFQQFNLFPHMTVLENAMEAPVSVLRRPKDEVEAEVVQLLQDVGLTDKMNARPGQLSGGQQQRVAIVRALAMKPALMLFDEPTSALDPEMVGEVLSVIRKVANTGMTMMIVTHEMAFARQVAGQVVILNEGRIIEQGDPEKIFSDPDDKRSRQFLQRVLHPEGIQDVD